LELPECREYPELQQRVFANAYFSKQKVKNPKTPKPREELVDRV